MVISYGLLLALGAVAVLLAVARQPTGRAVELQPPPTPLPLRVHVTGAVQAPGVYGLPPGSIVQDAITAAGGATAKANLGQINLARLLADGDQVLVPEVAPTGAAGGSAGAQSGAPAGGAGQPGLVNINTADAATLETLPGIGPTRANNIINYRNEHGPFASIEALLEVNGIGPATFEAIKDLITVG